MEVAMQSLSDFNSKNYGPLFADLLQEERLNPLDASTPNTKMRPALAALTIEKAFAPNPIVDADMARACLAGVWLYHDFLDESHQISQSIATTTGSYWHGIMHRREPDFSNSPDFQLKALKESRGFHRVGEHLIFEPLRMAAADIVSEEFSHESTEFLLTQSQWDSFAFIDLCETCVKRRSLAEMPCRRIQQVEWQLLFDYCYHHAIG
jgi:hypothetical protein